jgi:hypothetical protein
MLRDEFQLLDQFLLKSHRDWLQAQRRIQQRFLLGRGSADMLLIATQLARIPSLIGGLDFNFMGHGDIPRDSNLSTPAILFVYPEFLIIWFVSGSHVDAYNPAVLTLNEDNFQFSTLIGLSNKPLRGRLGTMFLAVIFQEAIVSILKALAHLVSRDSMPGRELFQHTFCYGNLQRGRPFVVVGRVYIQELYVTIPPKSDMQSRSRPTGLFAVM